MNSIAIAIPSLNEVKTIENTVRVIDNGLAFYRNKYKTFIVNVDNNSKDGTSLKFSNVPTQSKKVYISTPSNITGKGYNLVNFFRFVLQEKIDYCATIDADIRTLKPEWISSLIEPLINKKYDYITPLYKRNRFEGSTTNHFALPLLYGYFGKSIRQPIGGDFSFTNKTAKLFIDNQPTQSELLYGIDIFMSITACGNKVRIGQAYLGEKLHNPSFSKIKPMFNQILLTSLRNIAKYKLDPIEEELTMSINILENSIFPHKKEAKLLLEEELQFLKANINDYCFTDSRILRDRLRQKTEIDTNIWTSLLSDFLTYYFNNKSKGEKIAPLLTNLFLIHTIDFWNSAEILSAREVENKIIEQAKLLRTKLIKKTILPESF